MEYTKVLSALSHVKAVLEKKIDAVNTSVSGLPDTLDTQFTAVKKEISAVKTDTTTIKNSLDSANATIDAINGEVI